MVSTTTGINMNRDEIPTVKIEDSVFLGFRTVKENNIDYANFYFVLKDNIGDKYLAKYVFICDQEDLLYLGHNLFNSVNMAKFTQDKVQQYRQIMKDFNHVNSFYCDFTTVEDIYDNSYKCCMAKIEVNENHECKYVVIPNNLYFRIIYILEKVAQRYPFNPSIDKDEYFDNIKIYKSSNLKYLGILDNNMSKNNLVHPVYRLEYKHIPSGLIIPVRKSKNQKTVLPNVKKSQFVKDYVFDNFLISMDNLIWTHRKINDSIVPCLSIFRKDQDNKRMEVIMLDNNGQYLLTHLYEYIYIKGD